MASSKDSFTFTVGKLDAGMAILLGERAHLIEFPSILLPPGATAGSIVNISVNQNHAEERKRDAEFWNLQHDILQEFGVQKPDAPVLNLRNITQTSATLEWAPLNLATSKLRSLDIYRNGTRLAAIPAPHTNTSTKLSGLQLDTEYSFQLVLRTSAGTFPSNLLRVRTHTMENTSGICVCFGTVQDDVTLDNAKRALSEMGAKWSEKIQIDTTHFVCTTPAATPSGASAVGNTGSSPGVEYQRALQLSIPVVEPGWIMACYSQKKMVPIAAYYLGATPSIASAGFTQRPQSMSQANLHHTAASSTSLSHPSPNTNSQTKLNRASMPAPARQPSLPTQTQNERAPSLDEAEEHDLTERSEAEREEEEKEIARRKSRAGTMNRDFKFPPNPSPVQKQEQEHKQTESLPTGHGNGSGSVTPRAASPPRDSSSSSSSAPGSSVTASSGPTPRGSNERGGRGSNDLDEEEDGIVTPSSIDVPPPPPIEKERSVHSRSSVDEGEEEVGDTEEVDLS